MSSGKPFFMIIICYIALESSGYYVVNEEIMQKGFPLHIHHSVPNPGSAWLTIICDMLPALGGPARRSCPAEHVSGHQLAERELPSHCDIFLMAWRRRSLPMKHVKENCEFGMFKRH